MIPLEDNTTEPEISTIGELTDDALDLIAQLLIDCFQKSQANHHGPDTKEEQCPQS